LHASERELSAGGMCKSKETQDQDDRTNLTDSRTALEPSENEPDGLAPIGLAVFAPNIEPALRVDHLAFGGRRDGDGPVDGV
jgi:hypothetical protein